MPILLHFPFVLYFQYNFFQQKSTTFISSKMNANRCPIQWGSKPLLNKVKPPVDASDFYRASSIKIWAQIRQGEFDYKVVK